MTKLKRNSFLGGAGIYLFSNILNAIIPFILLPILTRYLSPAEYGEVAMFQTLIGALGAFVGITFVGAAGRKYYDADVSKSELAEFVGSCIQLAFVFTIVVFLVFLIFKKQLSEWTGLNSEYVLLAVLVAFSNVIIGMRLGQWQVQKKAIKYGVLQISQSLFNMILSLLFVVVFLKGAEGRIYAQILAGFVFLVVSFLLLKRDRLLSFFIFRKEYLSEALKFGTPLILHISGAFLLLSVDRFVIGKELGLTEVGIYMVAVQLVSIMSLVFDAVNKAYVPYLYECLKRNDFQEKVKLVKLIYIWFLLIFFGVFLAFLLGPWFVIFFAGDKYATAGNVIGLLALGQGFRGMYLMVTNFIFYSKKTVVLSTITICSGVFNLLLLICLVKLYGLIGAAISYAASMCMFFIVTWYFSTKLIDMPWRLK